MSLEQPLNVRWTYWPVSYVNGDPTVIGNAPLPLGGVQCSVGMRAVGQLKGSLQLADPSVRALYPWDKVIPRKTGIVAVRTVQDAATDRSQLATNPYEWTTTTRVLVGADGESAQSFRNQFVMGSPKLGRQLGSPYSIPRLVYDVNGNGNVLSFQLRNDASIVSNIIWGRGNGYADLQIKTQVQYSPQGVNEWDLGFMQTEGRYSNPDVKDVNTLNDQCYQQMYQSLGSQAYLSSLKIRGDLSPYFGSYVIGDQIILVTNDITWPPDYYGPNGYYELLVRLYGWTITPPEGDKSESVDLLLAAS
jgi:hypothetical protein